MMYFPGKTFSRGMILEREREEGKHLFSGWRFRLERERCSSPKLGIAGTHGDFRERERDPRL